MMSLPENHRYYTLDGMRGIAAIAVVLMHMSYYQPWNLAPNSDLAVDFFFVLSGFVLGKTYDRRLGRALSLPAFLRMRLIRLYPLFAVGVAMGSVKEFGSVLAGGQNGLSGTTFAVESVFNVLLLPSPVSRFLFPLNSPLWTLFLELLISLVYGSVLFRLRKRILLLIAAVNGTVLGFGVVHHGGLSIGPEWSTAVFGLTRVGLSFCIGVVLARIATAERRHRTPLSLIPPAILICVLVAPISDAARPLFDLLMLYVVLPSLIWCSAHWELPRILEATADVLGRISYPLYAIHFPLLTVFARALQWRGFGGDVRFFIAFLAASIVLAFLCSDYVDKPIRRYLNNFRLRNKTNRFPGAAESATRIG